MLDRAIDLGGHSRVEAAAVSLVEQTIIVGGNDHQMMRLLELAGILDVASCAWLSPIDEQGDVATPIAQLGQTSWIDIEKAIASANAIPGLFSDRRPPFAAPGLSDHVVCMIGNRNVGRAALFMRQRTWHVSVQTRLSDTIERIRQLVHIVWVILRETSKDLPFSPAANHDASLAEAVIDQYPFGVVILDLDQHAFLTNKAARLLCQVSSAIGLVGDRLVLHNTHDAIRFHLAVRGVLMAKEQIDETSVIAISGPEGTPLLLSISRLASAQNRASIVITRPSESGDRNIQPLAEHFGLTQVEARVVAQLVRGMSVQEAASALQLKVQTVRTYLKQIFHKTGAHRQVELFHLMRSGALPILN